MARTIGGERWQTLLQQERAKVPKGSSFGAYAAAAKRASARYHTPATKRNPTRATRSNPGGIGWGTVAIAGLAAYLVLPGVKTWVNGQLRSVGITPPAAG